MNAVIDRPPARSNAAVDKRPFEILVASVERDTVTDEIVRQLPDLPGYGGRATWTICSAEHIDAARCFDLCMVICSAPEALGRAKAAARELHRRRETALILLPKELVAAGDAVDGALMVGTNAPLTEGLTLLADTLIAPVLSPGLVCVDWADILTVLDAGDKAILMSAQGKSATAAIERLSLTMSHTRGIDVAAVCGSLFAPHGVRMGDYFRFFRAVADHMPNVEFRALTLPIREGRGFVACLLAVTPPD